MYQFVSVSNTSTQRCHRGRKTSALSPSMSVLFLLLLMKHCSAKSLACIASVVQQLLQMPLVVLIDIYFAVFMSTLVALVMTTLYTLYNAACFEIQLKWCFFNYRYFTQEGLTFLVF